MKEYTAHIYKTISRWDLLTRFGSVTEKQLPGIQKISLRFHEKHPKHYRDRHILAMMLELISGQRVSPRILEDGVYRKKLATKHSTDSIQVYVTLRKKNLYQFLDRWMCSLPRYGNLTSLRNLGFDKTGGTSFYLTEPFIFNELTNLNTFIHKSGGIQVHFITQNSSEKKTNYILSSFKLPVEGENTIVNRDYPVLNFFNT